jgi:hypothetical protein
MGFGTRGLVSSVSQATTFNTQRMANAGPLTTDVIPDSMVLVQRVKTMI